MRHWLALLLVAAALPAAAMTVKSGRVSGIVVDEAGAPVAGAVAILKWTGGWSSVAHGGTRCVKSIAVKSDAGGRFEVPAWTKVTPELQDLGYSASAYAPGWDPPNRPPLKGAAPASFLGMAFGGIEIAPSEVRIVMSRARGGDARRVAVLSDLLGATDCRDGDAHDARDFYLAIRAELDAMPAGYANRRPSSSRAAPIEIVDKSFLAPIGIVPPPPRLPIEEVPPNAQKLPAMAPKPADPAKSKLPEGLRSGRQ